MKVKYFVRNSKNIELGFQDLKEAFDLAKAIASYDSFVTLNKRTWNDNGGIIGYETCVVKADGSFSYLLRRTGK